jgi:hypothetical protein
VVFSCKELWIQRIPHIVGKGFPSSELAPDGGRLCWDLAERVNLIDLAEKLDFFAGDPCTPDDVCNSSKRAR